MHREGEGRTGAISVPSYQSTSLRPTGSFRKKNVKEPVGLISRTRVRAAWQTPLS